jgi:hypothetical protein
LVQEEEEEEVKEGDGGNGHEVFSDPWEIVAVVGGGGWRLWSFYWEKEHREQKRLQLGPHVFHPANGKV